MEEFYRGHQMVMHRKLRYFLSNMVVLWLAILFYRTNRYYLGYLQNNTQQALLYFAAVYSIGSFLYLIFARDPAPTKGYVMIAASWRLLKRYIGYLGSHGSADASPPRLKKREKTIILFALVKFFFLPLMLNFVFDNFYSLRAFFRSHDLVEFLKDFRWNETSFSFGVSLIFFIDTLFFAFGYMFEAGFLKNTIRSVEPTFLGWAAALLCYPPFNSMYEQFAGWHANINRYLLNDTLTMIVRIVILALLLVYLSATIALGTRCSNLTNRGVVGWGPYRFVRHPAYAAKNLAWWLSLIPVMSLAAFFSMAAWSALYFIRAITEERHLLADPDYRRYAAKVRWRFIPFVF